MRLDHLVAQKIRALIQRNKGRDLYDLWFILRTKLPIEMSLVSKLTGISETQALSQLEKRINLFSERQLAYDLNPFVRPSLREWIRKSLKSDTLQLLMSRPTISDQ